MTDLKTKNNMDKQVSKQIRELILSDHPVIRINRALGRDPRIVDDYSVVHTGWPDTTSASLPDFLVDTLNRQFSIDDMKKTKDLVLRKLSADDESFSYLVSLKEYISSIRKHFEDVVENSSPPSSSKVSILRSQAKASLNELDKMQVLVNAPLFGHNLAGGGHPLFFDTPAGYDIDDEFAKKAGEMFKAICKGRYYEYTVPALSSQGMTLKTRQDTPQFRIYAKAIMSALASKTKSRKDYDMVIEAMNEPFIERGYNGVANDFYLGMRRQGMRKDEVVSSKFDFDGSQDYDLGATNGIQGRSRGIFPPSEYTKHYFKPFAEGIKKSLFDSFFSTAVDLSFISAKVHLLTLLSIKYNLFNSDEEYICFYDLSAMDTTTHKGFMDSYHQFCKGLFPDFDNIEGDTFASCKLFFPAVIGSKEYFVQDIMGRSTLSGQPDVTTKNNICHILAMSWCLGKTFDVRPEVVFDHLMTGQGTLNGQQVIAHIHGDDTMIYMGSDPSKYATYYEHLGSLGFGVSFEKAPIFLKKTVSIEEVSTESGSFESSIVMLTDLLSGFSADFKSNDDYKDRCNRIVVEVCTSLGYPPVNDYNNSYVGNLIPVLGSLIKNRFGEYPTVEPILHVMSLMDTCKLMSGHWSQIIKDYWFFLLKLIDYDSSDPLFAQIIALEDADQMEILFKSDQFSADVQSMIIKLSEGSITKANSIRTALERLYYSGGESLNDFVLDTVFGSLFITQDLLLDKFDLRSMSLNELLDLYKQLQSIILDTNGKAPNIDESIFDIANGIIKNLGKLERYL